jgi:hypothetical protein
VIAYQLPSGQLVEGDPAPLKYDLVCRCNHAEPFHREGRCGNFTESCACKGFDPPAVALIDMDAARQLCIDRGRAPAAKRLLDAAEAGRLVTAELDGITYTTRRWVNYYLSPMNRPGPLVRDRSRIQLKHLVGAP